jgi:hypothetical protein
MGWDNQAVTQLVITALAQNSGVFVYSGSPGLGNLIAAISGGGTDEKDQYGNVYSEVLTIGNDYKLLVDREGQLYQFNPGGALLTFLSAQNSVFIIYNDTGTAVQGSITFAFSQNVFSDPFGNTIGQGFTIGYCGVPTEIPGPSSILLYCDAAGNLNALTADNNTRLIAAV